MQYDKLEEKDNPIFKRKEFVLKMDYDGPTPSKASLQQMLAKDFKTEPNRVEVHKIISFNGRSSGKIWIRVWEEKDIEIYTEKNAPKEEAQAEVSAEEKKEEAEDKPAEEKPEEAKKEVKEESPAEVKEGEN